MKNFGTVIDNFDAVTKQYVDNKVPTDEHIKGIKVDNATSADTAKKVQNAFTYKAHNKAAGTVVPITYDGSKAASLDFSADDFAYDYSSGKDIKIKLVDKDYATTAQVEERYKKPNGGIPKSDLATSVQTSLDKADSALQSAPVTSVNGKTDAVQLGASDVGALPTSTKYVVSVNGESGEVKNIAKTNSANTFTGDQTVTGNGSVSGNFTVGGNLTVNGTTTTVDSTTLQVKDKLIEVAHGNTTTLTTPAGLVAPKYDGTNSGALVFDSTGTAYVGDVTLKDGNIDVANSGLQPLATRTGLVGGNLVQYDSSALTLKDSGKKISDFATSVKVNGNTIAPSGGVVDIGTVLTDASAFATSAQGTKADNAMPKSGGTFTGEVKFGNTENFQGYYIKRMIGGLSAGTAYANLSSSYKDGTWHRMWRLRFPSGSSFWGKIKITLYGGYSSFNASGVMSKSITCNFNTSNIYNNVGCYDGLGVNVEQDFRISEAIWNATVNAWEVLIWQKNLNGNNSPAIMLECWTRNDTNYINAFNSITAQTVELTQSTSYSAQKASPTGGTKTVEWATLPVYENPLGEEIATMSDLPNSVKSVIDYNKADERIKIGYAGASLASADIKYIAGYTAGDSESVARIKDIPKDTLKSWLGYATVATSGSYNDLVDKPTIPDISGKLDKTKYEVNKTIDFGSSGFLYVGKFKVYDTNVTCEIASTTNVTYSGKLVIATQNYVIQQMTVYGDAANTVTPNIYIKPSSGSDPYIEVYFKPESWSKNVVHIYGCRIEAEPTDVCTNVPSVPSTATLKPKNALDSKANVSDIPSIPPIPFDSQGLSTGTLGSTQLPSAGRYYIEFSLETTTDLIERSTRVCQVVDFQNKATATGGFIATQVLNAIQYNIYIIHIAANGTTSVTKSHHITDITKVSLGSGTNLSGTFKYKKLN